MQFRIFYFAAANEGESARTGSYVTLEPTCMKKISGIVAASVLLSLVLLYAIDYIVLRARSAAYGSVTVRQYYAIQEKNNRTEYVFGSAVEQPCVNSLFGHQGLRPCWYLRRHQEQQVQI